MIDTKKMKLGDFEEFVKQLNYLLRWYKKPYVNNSENNYTLFLSNGDKIDYSFPERSISHLLGVKTEEVKIRGMYSENSSFALLKKMCENPYAFYNAMNRSNVTFNQLLSYYYDNKFATFKDHFLININNIIFVCKYDAKMSYINGFDKRNIDYIIATEKDDKILLLGLKKMGNTYVPATSQLLDAIPKENDYSELSPDEKKLASFIQNQTLLLPETLLIDRGDTIKKYYLFDEKAKNKLNTLWLYVDKYECTVDVLHYCEYTLNTSINARNISNSLLDYWNGKGYVEPDIYSKTPNYLLDLLEKGKTLSNCSKKDSISSLKEMKELMQKVSEYETQITELKISLDNAMENILKLQTENSSLRTYSEEMNKTIQGVKELVLKK